MASRSPNAAVLEYAGSNTPLYFITSSTDEGARALELSRDRAVLGMPSYVHWPWVWVNGGGGFVSVACMRAPAGGGRMKDDARSSTASIIDTASVRGRIRPSETK